MGGKFGRPAGRDWEEGMRKHTIQAVSQLKKVEKDRRILRFGPE